MRSLLLAGLVAVLVQAALRRVPSRAVRAPRSTSRMLLWRAVVRGPAAALALVAAAVVLSPAVAVTATGGWWLHRRTATRRQASRHADDLARALPDTVDLLILASSAGLQLPVAHPLLAAHAPAPLRPALLAADAAARAGQPRADALLASLGPLGDRARALAEVLGDHLRYGVPLLPGLERTRLELGLDRRRRAERAARRVPVQLLGPLVACVLPAFALLTVVPLLGASLRALPT